MTTAASILRAVKDIRGERRFYPRDQHPAADRARAQLASIEATVRRHPQFALDLLAARRYLRSVIRSVEHGEMDAKQRYLDTHPNGGPQ